MNIDQTAASFFRADDVYRDENSNGSVVRTWVQRITKAQVAKLMKAIISQLKDNERVHQVRGRDRTHGTFERDGLTYYWNMYELKYGAAQFTVRATVKQAAPDLTLALGNLHVLRPAYIEFMLAYEEVDFKNLNEEQVDYLKAQKAYMRDVFTAALAAVKAFEE